MKKSVYVVIGRNGVVWFSSDCEAFNICKQQKISTACKKSIKQSLKRD